MPRTLFVGHSLVGQAMPTMFNNFMESESLDIQADAQVINGAPLRYNWDNGASAQGVNAREVLPSGDYDTVIVTEAIPLDAQLQENDTQGYAARYFDLAQSANADTRFYLYETWHEIGADTQEWRAQITEDLPKWQGVIDYVNDNAAAGAPEALVIPAGQAMGRLHDAIEAGEVPGLNSIRDLFSDNIHLNDTGNWFIAALHASALTGVDAASLPLETFDIWGGAYDGPDAALAEVMADVIDATLDDFLSQGAVSTYVARDDVVQIEDPDETPLEEPVLNNNTPLEPIWTEEPLSGAGNDLLAGDSADNTLHGESGDDSLYGGDGNDVLTGGAGNDVIVGDGGDDVLTLGDGADTVSGGDGNDVFVLTGEPGSVLITDFGANGAQDMIDLSAIGGYSSFADVAAVASFPGADTVLTFAVPNGVLTVTVHSDNPLTSGDFGLPTSPDGPTELLAPADPVAPDDSVTPVEPVEPVATDDPVDPVNPTDVTYTIEGADTHHFAVDPVTGDISNQPWFVPTYERIWDISGDRIYEVERIGSDADGQEVSRTFFELETTSDGVVWREVSGEGRDIDAEAPEDFVDTADPVDISDPVYPTDKGTGPETHYAVDPIQPVDDNATFFMEGPDDCHFVIDPQSGEIDNISWFDPSYDRVWDTNGDRIYEIERFALAEDGTEISREALEMETTPDGVVWRIVSSSEEDEMSGAQIMSALALPPAEEKDLPPEPEEIEDELILSI